MEMNPLIPLPSKGILNDVLADLVSAPPRPSVLRLAFVSCGVKVHFPRDKACARHRAAADLLKSMVTGLGGGVNSPATFYDYLRDQTIARPL